MNSDGARGIRIGRVISVYDLEARATRQIGRRVVRLTRQARYVVLTKQTGATIVEIVDAAPPRVARSDEVAGIIVAVAPSFQRRGRRFVIGGWRAREPTGCVPLD